jgi:hypothetical protein
MGASFVSALLLSSLLALCTLVDTGSPPPCETDWDCEPGLVCSAALGWTCAFGDAEGRDVVVACHVVGLGEGFCGHALYTPENTSCVLIRQGLSCRDECGVAGYCLDGFCNVGGGVGGADDRAGIRRRRRRRGCKSGLDDDGSAWGETLRYMAYGKGMPRDERGGGADDDASHGRPWSKPRLLSGGAPCPRGRDDCDGDGANGCETSIDSDPGHCGACNVACDVGLSCDNSVCTRFLCDQGFADCDSDVSGGLCETSLMDDVDNCGACGTRCPRGPRSETGCVHGACELRCQDGYAEGSGDEACVGW